MMEAKNMTEEMEYDIDNRDFNTTRLWIKIKGRGCVGYIEVCPKELVDNARENNPEEEHWNKSDRTYAGFLKELGIDRKEWFKFAGMALCAGIELDMPIDKIVECVMETVHGMDIDTEVPLTYEQVVEEMKLWKKESE